MPTRTVYTFADTGVRIVLTFFTPAFPEDLDLLSRPVTYVNWDVASTDGKKHEVSIYLGRRSGSRGKYRGPAGCLEPSARRIAYRIERRFARPESAGPVRATISGSIGVICIWRFPTMSIRCSQMRLTR